MQKSLLSDVLKMTKAERILFIQDVWDSIAISQEEIELTESQKQELDKRLDAFQNDPNAGTNWQTVKQQF